MKPTSGVTGLVFAAPEGDSLEGAMQRASDALSDVYETTGTPIGIKDHGDAVMVITNGLDMAERHACQAAMLSVGFQLAG